MKDRLHIKSSLLIFSLLFCIQGYCQDKSYRFKFYINNEKSNFENTDLFMVTGQDSIKVLRDGDKIIFPGRHDKFDLIAKIESDYLNLGSFQLVDLLSFKGIILGKITDLSKLKTRHDDDSIYVIDGLYPFALTDPENVKEVIFGLIDYKDKFTTDSRSKKYRTYKKVKRLKT